MVEQRFKCRSVKSGNYSPASHCLLKEDMLSPLPIKKDKAFAHPACILGFVFTHYPSSHVNKCLFHISNLAAVEIQVYTWYRILPILTLSQKLFTLRFMVSIDFLIFYLLIFYPLNHVTAKLPTFQYSYYTI